MKKGNFQLIFLIIFMAAAIFGVLVFSGMIPLGSDNSTDGSQGTVVLWGTAKSQIISPLISEFNTDNPTFILKYVEKPADTFDTDLLEALASGKGPDLFFIDDSLAFKYSNKIFTIPYQSFPISTFKNNFIGAGEVFLTSKGVIAFPIAVDPLMMYYNRTMLDANSIAFPPTFWDEFSTLIPLLTKKDDKGTIIKSTIAMGQFSNVLHAKDILSVLFMQTGNTIVGENNGSFYSDLSTNGKYGLNSVLSFYTDFTNPLKDVYSWNKSFSNSRDAFSKEDLAFYFGFASEFKSLVNKNPNQNFLVAPIPQVRGSNNKITFAHVTGIAISSFSKNFNSAFGVAGLLANGDFASKFSTSLGIVPARRNLISITPSDAYSPSFYSSAFFARSWLDPSSVDSDKIFRGMIEKVVSGSMSAEEAVTDANSKLRLLLIR